MAIRRTVTMVDDLNGEPLDDGGESLSFLVDGRAYEIDLTSANAAAFREALAPYVEAARQLQGPPRTRKARAKRS
ncbi:Lsr2 family protein [Plantibacter sp. PA-3-X8]|uniref:histone-like nucleoid-structuring protein Lsr2 n=1 Tax=unclassified Plantibacter TaxID=2624265 RepID=UPI000F5DABB7|nr:MULTISPECIES: Lsr2 family protein [unclassified Plantibacter]AZH83558.1 Lsr2 family protein [Plantibacter sp. PA-3-X8]